MQQAGSQNSSLIRNPLIVSVIAAALIISAAMGARQTFGLFLTPLALDRGLPIGLIALAIAVHNLVWGLAQPLAGAAADRYGAPLVVAVGAISYAAGLALAATTHAGTLMMIGLGLLVGIGMSCTTFGVVMTAVGRTASADKRSMAMGLATAGGSLGQMALPPMTQLAIDDWGLAVPLFSLAILLVAVGPFGLLLGGNRAKQGPSVGPHGPSLGVVLPRALRHRGYLLLTLGFFTCGFQLAFISTYLPGYLSLCHMPMGLGAVALALIGFFNMIGSWACGWLGGRLRQQHVLGWLYLVRAAAIAAFFLAPKSEAGVVVFAAVMGLTWLGTVPLTSGWVAKIFGVGHLGTLFGVCFFSHQIGSFLGAWLGGLVFSLTGSYGPVWILTAVSGVVAALLHFPIRDQRPEGLPQLARA